ncbi:MAG TPA: FAD-binding oxidoreductase [Candidatus Limnocylindrales bacterium]
MALFHLPADEPRELDLDAFEAALAGLIVRPSDPDYEAARHAHNTAFDRLPAVIVQAADTADVALTVDFAAATGLDLAVRSGGHSVAGHSSVDGGIVLDLGNLRGLQIDPKRRIAWAQAGLTAGEYTAAAYEHGLATSFGDAATVGLGGITLGGGIGWLVRKHGLTIDHLIAAEVVTADGRIVMASEDENEDLFWAIRGGGGNFGIVTRFCYRLHPLGMITGGVLVLPATKEVLRGIVPLAAAAPEELTTITSVMAAPPLPAIPADVHGKPVVAVLAVFAGDAEAGAAAMAPFRALATPIADLVGPMPYPAMYELTAAGSVPGPAALRSMFLDDLDDESIDEILARMARPSSPMAMAQIRVLGGAMARVPTDATAFAHRERRVMFTVLTPYLDPAQEPVHTEWTTAFAAAILPKANGVYSNFVADEGEGRVRDAYPEATYARLAEIKRRYDPTNLFHLNQNIRPAVSPVRAL